MNHYEFETTPGDRLPFETRIPLPEMSYEQEILNTDVPFENRTAFLSEYDKLDSAPILLTHLADQLDMSVGRARAYALEVNAIVLEEYPEDVLFDIYTKPVIEQELAWEDDFLQLDDYVPVHKISNTLSIGESTVHQLAYGLGIYPQFVETGKRRSILYPKELASQIRLYRFHFPPSAGWSGIKEAESYVGKSGEWIMNTVKKYELKHGKRMSGSNVFSQHFPQETLDELLSIKQELPQFGGDWVTERRMEALIGASKGELQQYLAPYADASEQRLADTGHERIHYPPWVILQVKDIRMEAMRAKLEKQLAQQEKKERVLSAAPPANDWLTIPMVAEMVQRPRSWVESRLGQLGIESERRRDRMNRPNPHVPPESVDELQLHFLIDEENTEV